MNSVLLSPKDVVASDVDGDGVTDVVAVSDVDDILVWSPGLGGREFGPYQILLYGLDGPERLGVFDLEGDGDDDWVVALNSGQDLLLIESLGAGQVAAGRSLDPNAGRVLDLATGDLDGDGDTDVVAALADAGVVAWYENLGGGQFGPRQAVAAIGGTPAKVQIVDVDVDGQLDVLWLDSATDTAGLVRQNGAGTFDPPLTVSSGESNIRRVAAGDLDGDGDVEILVGRRFGLVVYALQLGGGYAEQSRLAGPFFNGASACLEVNDVDGDGLDEVLAREPTYAARSHSWDPSTGTLDFGVPLFVAANNGLAIVDVDNDSVVDLLGVSDAVIWGAGDGSGGFNSARVIGSRLDAGADGTFEDIDGDGDLDYFVNVLGTGPAFSGVFFIERLGENEFAVPEQVAAAAVVDFESMDFADMDGDGLKDLTYLRANNSSFPTVREAVMHPRSAAGDLGPAVVLAQVTDSFAFETRVFWEDVDADGRVDLLVSTKGTAAANGISWRRNDGTGQLGAAQVVEPGQQRRIRAIDDFNGDGLIDFVSSSVGPRQLRVTYGSATDPTGFLPPQTLLMSVNTRRQLTMDVDADGDVDLVSFYVDSGLELAIFENVNGALRLNPTPVASLGSAVLVSADAGDRNGDGQPDVLAILGGLGSSARLFLGNGSGFDPSQDDAVVGLRSASRVRFMDADGDADDDLLVELPVLSALQVRLYENEAQVGVDLCPGQPNSTGGAAQLEVTGLDEVNRNRMVLTASQLPANSTVFFLTSTTTGFSAGAGGSQGDLCLGGSIGRYVGPGQVLNSGAEGLARLVLDLTQMPDPALGGVQALAGESWSFQGWYRDANPGVTSNFTEGQTVTLR